MYIISAPNLNLVSSRLQMYFTSLYKLLSDDGPVGVDVDVDVDAVCRYGIRGQVMAEEKNIYYYAGDNPSACMAESKQIVDECKKNRVHVIL